MSGSKLSEVHQKLKDFGITIDALSSMTKQDAINLLNYKNSQVKDYIEPDDLRDYYDFVVPETNLVTEGAKS
tara:strand:+ start:2447 stop:2662 length:216 start_codon:yes stop_codon:yes gene_type:complete